MTGKKTGLYLTPLADEIVKRVAEQFGYTKISNTVNYIILEYDKLVNQKQEVIEVKEEKQQTDFSGWFIVEEKNA